MDKNFEKISKKINNKVYNVVGSNLYKIRKSTHKSQPDFANELRGFLLKEFHIKSNYDHKTISNWENGKSMPRLDILVAISKHYNLSLDEMLYEEIKDIVSYPVFSNSESDILGDLVKLPSVCEVRNGKSISSFAPENYMYGQLSYLVDNLVDYRGDLSKSFSVTHATKRASIVVGILDINNGKRELHYLGNGKDDIVDIENSSSNCFGNTPIDCLDQYKHIIRLGNGKCYHINEMPTECDRKGFVFEDDNIPKDLSDYDLNKDEYDWTDYACLRGHYIIDDNLFDIYTSGGSFYKNAGVFEIELCGDIKCTDAQLVKVLVDDYKHRLVKKLSAISDQSTYEMYKKEMKSYEKTQLKKEG